MRLEAFIGGQCVGVGGEGGVAASERLEKVLTHEVVGWLLSDDG
jgi:hypothetical protein